MPIQPCSKRAIVIGGSIAGLLSAKVLSAFFEEVIILERDDIETKAAERRGVPQSPQPHILLTGGYRVLKNFFPSIDKELLAAGAVPVDWGQDFHFFAFGGWNATSEQATELRSFSCTRPLLENAVRQQVEQVENIKRLSPCRVEALTGDESKITGVQYRQNRTEEARSLFADLVIDASGRSSNAAVWLSDRGCATPTVSTVDAGLGYATGRYRIPDGWKDRWKVLLVSHKPPDNYRLGYLAQIEGDEWIATLGGYCKHYPSLDQAEFLDFAKALPAAEFGEAIAQATPVSKIKAYRSTANKLRHYEQLSQMPDGFIAIGDAVCALCPAYGQGLTVSGLSALVLRDWLDSSDRKSKPLNSLAFQKALAKKTLPAWNIATKSDSGFDPEAERPKASLIGRLLSGYMQRLLERSHTDSELSVSLAKVNHMVDSPAKLLSPKLLVKAIVSPMRTAR